MAIFYCPRCRNSPSTKHPETCTMFLLNYLQDIPLSYIFSHLVLLPITLFHTCWLCVVIPCPLILFNLIFCLLSCLAHPPMLTLNYLTDSIFIYNWLMADGTLHQLHVGGKYRLGKKIGSSSFSKHCQPSLSSKHWLLYISRDFANATITTYFEAHLQSIVARSILLVPLWKFVHSLQYVLSWCSKKNMWQVHWNDWLWMLTIQIGPMSPLWMMNDFPISWQKLPPLSDPSSWVLDGLGCPWCK